MENAAFLLQHGADPDSQDQVLDSPLVVGMPSGGETCDAALPPLSAESCIQDVFPPGICVFCSHSLGLHRPGEAAAPARCQGRPGGLPRPLSAPRGLAAGQSHRGDAAAGGRCTSRSSEPLRPHATGAGGSGGAPGGGAGSAGERSGGRGSKVSICRLLVHDVLLFAPQGQMCCPKRKTRRPSSTRLPRLETPPSSACCWNTVQTPMWPKTQDTCRCTERRTEDTCSKCWISTEAEFLGGLPVNAAVVFCVLRALELLVGVTCKAEVSESGMSPLHSAAAGGHPPCLKVSRGRPLCLYLPQTDPPFALSGST